ncbi:hypothetical protein Cs7R123_48320 [Catellatospora sp. TT07R-123]|uniref:hypothetical protein n=1 Tax=Catellatospora sp. TT07R-123 TaxID=2733863 RepID=UPI001B1831DD|nr:hypothetical protein [Catellatospora sp. TT07R-123]GHJ47490.1 hypothetical protein Cs7R123_48320 [Catellatospora sp. TT07R-123]
MSGSLLTTTATMTCPHGGTVTALPTQSRVTLGGGQAVYATDTFVVAGCPFAPVSPHPCVRVQWQLTSQKGSGGEVAALTADSVGFCFAADGALQGSVLIQAAQTNVTGE